MERWVKPMEGLQPPSSMKWQAAQNQAGEQGAQALQASVFQRVGLGQPQGQANPEEDALMRMLAQIMAGQQGVPGQGGGF